MGNDLISRSALLVEVNCNDWYEGHCCAACDAIKAAPAVDAVSKAAYDDLYAKYCELARLTNGEIPKLMKLMQEFNNNAPQKKEKSRRMANG